MSKKIARKSDQLKRATRLFLFETQFLSQRNHPKELDCKRVEMVMTVCSGASLAVVIAMAVAVPVAAPALATQQSSAVVTGQISGRQLQ